jgi:hypothetical protein
LLHRSYEDEPDKSGRVTIADESRLFRLFPPVPTPLREHGGFRADITDITDFP